MTTDELIKELKTYAEFEKVPIMQDEGIEFLTSFIVKNGIENVLEVGTAIGYSAIKMCLASPRVKVVTIERDEERYMEALKNIKLAGLDDRITPIYKDALDVNLKDKFDLIFLDGAKGQNINFLEHFEDNLDKGGYFITDNINFHGLVDKDEKDIKSKNLRGLVRKIKAYKDYLIESDKYDTEFLNIGDGLSVTKRKKEK
jgi:predicted O-methyltransferase YrrM